MSAIVRILAALLLFDWIRSMGSRSVTKNGRKWSRMAENGQPNGPLTPDVRALTRNVKMTAEALDGRPLVYVLALAGTDWTKIGVTSSLPRRLRTIQTGAPLEIEVLRAVLVSSKDEARGLEGALHDAYATHRIRGEWFEIPNVRDSLAAVDAQIVDCLRRLRLGGKK